MSSHDTVRVGLVSTSDRASQGVYKDEGIPALEEWLAGACLNPLEFERRLIADERNEIEKALKELVDARGCHLVITTGGTGPAPRDVTPDATLAVADREMPGFGEQMRRMPYCIDLIGGPYTETREEVVKAFRPKSAIRPPRS